MAWKKRVDEDAVREERIIYQAVVDAYDEIERSLGWYYYLADRLAFPFQAKCVGKVLTSPLRVGEAVKVVGMSKEIECEHDMIVNIKWHRSILAVPLSQLEPVGVSDETQEAVADWHYWMARGYQF